MRNRKFSLVTAILLLLLAAAVINIFFIYRAYNRTEQEPAPEAPVSETARSHRSSPSSAPPRSFPGMFVSISWYADVTISRSGTGKYELYVLAYERGSRRPFPIDSVEVYVRRPGEEKGFTPALKSSSAGKFIGPIDFPSGGSWEVHLRMHRGLQTLDVTKKFEID